MDPLPTWRAATREDIAAMKAVADAVHPAFPEDAAVFAERRQLYPAGARVLEGASTVLGYLLSHPWRSGTIPALNALMGNLPAGCDTFYLHDLALLPAARGTGAAAGIVAQMTEHARAGGFATMSLVAVNGSVPFWQRRGFRIEERAGLEAKLRSYGAEARSMVKGL